MTKFDRTKWIEEGCVCVDAEKWNCSACPYVVYDDGGYPKCDKEIFKKCIHGEI